MNKQFTSVFTAKDVTNISLPGAVFRGGVTEQLVDIKISEEAEKSRLKRMKKDNSPGDDRDNMSPRLLKMISQEITHPVTLRFNQSMKEGDVSLD